MESVHVQKWPVIKEAQYKNRDKNLCDICHWRTVDAKSSKSKH